MASASTSVDAGKGVFCNRTLNLRGIRAVGCDMDYTLIHYDVERWERTAYEHVRARLSERGLPVEELRFDPELVTRGLVLDLELGNVVKASRFGYVTRASHGTRMLSHEEQRSAYSRVWVQLAESRWEFMNTLFSLSEACLYCQLVDLLDAGRLGSHTGYRDLYALVREGLNEAHLEGALKAEIMREPESFVELDPELPLALLDLKRAGKLLMVITNSEWPYTRAMMSYAFDRFLPEGMGWRELFDLVIVSADKPRFFEGRAPIYHVVDEEGLLRPHVGKLELGQAYLGGHARRVERDLGLAGDDILYVGDHIYADVHVSSQVLRWRTALVLRELEAEVRAEAGFAGQQRELEALMRDKEQHEREQARLRLALQRSEAGYAEPPAGVPRDPAARLRELRGELEGLDGRIAPLARAAGTLVNARWGPLLRAGNDKSQLARQLERYADVYTSRVSNFLHVTPYAYLRAPGGDLPHHRS